MSNETPKISVIVPVYKTEKYLCKCVDSILGQTLTDIEVILVDDGSPDNCPHICDEYAAKDSRVKVIHKKNEGLGRARKDGWVNATGEYVLFVDSDDWIEADAAETAYNYASSHNVDMVYFDWIEDAQDSETRLTQPDYENAEYFEKLLEFKINAYAWNRLIRRSLFDEHLILPEGNLLEDFVLVSQLASKAFGILHLKEALYHYNRANIGSITASGNKANNIGKVLNLIVVFKWLSDSGLSRGREKIMVNIANYAGWVYFRYHLSGDIDWQLIRPIVIRIIKGKITYGMSMSPLKQLILKSICVLTLGCSAIKKVVA